MRLTLTDYYFLELILCYSAVRIVYQSLHHAVELSYILEHDNPIGDGETIDGIENGRMSREIQWKCQYEDALIQPPRGVVDIHMGDYASGKR